MYSVYGLQDPRDMLIHYVGIAKDPYRRYAMHLLISGKTEKDAWIRELRGLGLSPLLVILESELTKEEAEIRETYWIRHYLDIGSPLANTNKTGPKEEQVAENIPEDETMKEIFRQEGWTLHLLRRRTKGRVYVYAARRVGKKQRHIYIASLEKAEQMTEEELLGLLRQAS